LSLLRIALIGSGAHIQWVPEALSLGVKRPGREAHHSPPTVAEVKKDPIFTYTLQSAVLSSVLGQLYRTLRNTVPLPLTFSWHDAQRKRSFILPNVYFWGSLLVKAVCYTR
jgi:hypothetical protein